MRRCLIIAAFLPSLYCLGVTLDVARLPEPEFADREVSVDAELPAGLAAGGDFRVFRLVMEFSAAPSNCVQVALGRDTLPFDGRLAAGESDLVVGWDCGEWFLRPQGLKERFAFPAAGVSGPRALTVSIRVNARGVPQSAVFRDGEAAFSFPGLALDPFPDWLRPGLWTRLRVTSRGAEAPGESVKTVFAPDGARVIVR